MNQPHNSHRWPRAAGKWFLTVMMVLAGCTTPLSFRDSANDFEEELEPQPVVQLVGDATRPYGVNYIKVEAISLVTGLDGTGSDPPPSSQRSVLIDEMQTRKVRNANEVLASLSNSMVIVRGFLPPGIRKGERFDVEVRVRAKSEAISLAGGWLMPTRLKEIAVLGNRIHEGHVLGHAEGNVLINALVRGEADDVHKVRGRVLGGGVAAKSRNLGLVVRSGHRSVRTSSLIGKAINERFHGFRNGVKQGMATPKRDDFIELQLHPRYRNNIVRYIRVVQSLPLQVKSLDRVVYMHQLGDELLAPETSATAAMRLEALGSDGAKVLVSGLRSNNSQVKFHAAEALAYLDDGRAAPILAKAASSEPAFRWQALTALATMESPAAFDELTQLLHDASAETRYGAFRALREANPLDPLVKGENLGDQFHYHVVHSTGDPLVHITRQRRPEIVVFGDDVKLDMPFVLLVGKRLMIDARDGESVKISRYAPGESGQHEHCTAALHDVIQTAVKLGASYPEIVEILQKAKAGRHLQAKVAVDAVAKRGRVYRPDDGPTDDDSSDSDSAETVSTESDDGFADKDSANKDDSPKAPKGILGKIPGL